jgi:signal transduction histidine kinase
MRDTGAISAPRSVLIPFRNGLILTIIALVLIEGLTRAAIRVPTPGAILLLPVAYAAFTGGVRMGLASAMLVSLYALYRFATPATFLQYSYDNAQTVLTLVLVAGSMAIMIGSLKQQIAELTDTLDQRVSERTAQLARANAALEQAAMTKDRFLASMSHELRTPLNAIIGFTGTLLMRLPGPLTGDQERQLGTIQHSAQHLLALINDILDLAKIESGTVEMPLESVECQAVIAEVAAGLRALAERKGLQLLVDCPVEPIAVQANRRALSQILINLVNNAIKFTEQGSVQITLDQPRERQVAIHVNDTGIGMHPDDQAQLFQLFTQLGDAQTRQHEGTGLGLHLSQRLAHLLGGQITVQSAPHQGSTFTLILPLA